MIAICDGGTGTVAWYERAVWSVRGQNREDMVKLVGYVVVVLQCKGSSIKC